MKKIIISIILCLANISIWAQLPPMAINDTASTTAGFSISIDVLANDWDPDGDSILIIDATSSNGYVNDGIKHLDSIERLHYSPNFYFTGIDTITYTIAEFRVFPLPVAQDTAHVFVYVEEGDPKYILDANNYRIGVVATCPNLFRNSSQEQSVEMTEIPKGSSLQTLSSSSVWIGGYDNMHNLYFTNPFNKNGSVPYDLQFGPICNEQSTYQNEAYKNKWQNVWGLTKSEIEHHIFNFNNPDYEMPWAIENWPAHGDTEFGQAENLALFIDVNENDTYDPENGDYPLIYGDQAAFIILNDDIQREGSEIQGLKIEMHCMLFEFESPNNEDFYNTLFLNNKILNRSNIDYDSTMIGYYTDFSIGNSYDDGNCSNVNLGAYIGYNGNNKDESYIYEQGYGNNPPAQGQLILKGPRLDDDGIDNTLYNSTTNEFCYEAINGFGYNDGIIDNECYGMSRYMGSSSPYYPAHFSNLPLDYEVRFNFLNAKWKDNTHLCYGGEGYQGLPSVTDIPANFLYPGTTDSLNWGTISEQYPNGWDQTQYQGYPWNDPLPHRNKVGVSSMGPFIFESGDEEDLFFAYIYARDYYSNNKSITKLEARMSAIKNAFRNNEAPGGGTIYGVEETTVNQAKKSALIAYPNPATDIVHIEMEVNSAEIRIYDMYGRLIMQKSLDEGNSINISDLKTGVYLVTLESNNITSTCKLLKK